MKFQPCRAFTPLICGLMLFPLAACRRGDAIRTYRVPKEQPAPPMGTIGMVMPGEGFSEPRAGAASRPVDWTVPSGWKEQAPSAMRLGSFLITGANGQQADMSVVPLAGDAGGDLANVNRWRGQINLPPLSDSQLTQESQAITPGGRRMLFVDFVSREPLLGNRYKKRLMAAIYKTNEQTWFFKMIGEDAAVREAKPSFMSFLKNLKFHHGK